MTPAAAKEEAEEADKQRRAAEEALKKEEEGKKGEEGKEASAAGEGALEPEDTVNTGSQSVKQASFAAFDVKYTSHVALKLLSCLLKCLCTKPLSLTKGTHRRPCVWCTSFCSNTTVSC